MKVSAKLNNLRIAPRKTRLVANLIKGLDVQGALNQLDLTVKGSSLSLKKLLESAIANGENNFGIDRNNMYVFDVIVGAGSTLKRWMPKAYGRAGMIHKRTSKIELILEEKVEGKDRKSKEQLEKERQQRLEEKRKAERKAEEKKEEKKAASVTPQSASEEAEKGRKPVEKKRGLAGRIFRRKSM